MTFPQFRKHKDLRTVQNRMKEIVNHVDKVSPGLWVCPPSSSVGTGEVPERLA